MKDNIKMNFIPFILFTIINVLGGLINTMFYNFVFSIKSSIEVIPMHVFFYLLFFVSILPKLKIDIIYRLQILRGI
mgnify:CR=1 FL=1